jgi:hypothetical protein
MSPVASYADFRTPEASTETLDFAPFRRSPQGFAISQAFPRRE